MSATCVILNRKTGFAVVATDSRVTFDVGGEYEFMDGATKLRSAGDGCVYTVTDSGPYADEVREALTKPLPGRTPGDKATNLHALLKRHEADLSVLIVGFEPDGPALFMVKPERVQQMQYADSTCATIGLERYVPRLWNRVYVKTPNGLEEHAPVSLHSASLSMVRAADAAVFLIQSGAKYTELCSGDYSTKFGLPSVGGPVDLAMMTPEKVRTYRIGGGYGFDATRLTED